MKNKAVDTEGDIDAESVLNSIKNDYEFGAMEKQMIQSSDILNESRVAPANEWRKTI